MNQIKISWLAVCLGLLGSWGVGAQTGDTRSLASFSVLKVSQGIDVYLRKGDKESARVVANGVSTDKVLTDVFDKTLKIHMSGSSYRNIDVKVYVTYVSLNKIYASSAGSVFAEGAIKSPSLTISAGSAGSVEVSIDSQDVILSASSAGEITVEGKTDRLEVDASSAGDIDAYNLEANRVTVDVSSAGSAKVTAVKELEAEASSGGDVRYRGSPAKLNTSSSSGGSVKKTN
ncbi:MAG: DUF2807 domain-containing protein [Cyclobacteriaceae bacterium]|jgi:hypothetical protein|nr:DUF2807 domain-containing protein [Cyclobacteriaceae bacterium]